MNALAWSIRRELWEHRSLYLAPAGVALLVLLGFVATAAGVEMTRRLDSIAPERQAAMLSRPFEGAAVILMATSFLVAIFFCLDALHGERRDRSILFWKSLPVGDRTVVLAKALVPMLVVPAITLCAGLAVELAMLLIGSVMLIATGASAAPLWQQVPHLTNAGVLLYTLTTMALWHAPIYAWCLAASAIAPRAPLLFALLPWLAVGLVELLVLGSQGIFTFLRGRFAGVFDAAFSRVKPVEAGALLPLQAVPDLARFLSTPGFWGGLVVATGLVALAISVRRRSA